MSNQTSIGTVCYVYDGPHATPAKTEQGPVYLGIDAITDDGHINQAEYSHLSESDYKIWTKRVTPQYGDVVFSYEATLGRYALIPEGFHGCLGRRLAVVRPKDNRINVRWLYYYFLSPEWKVFIANHTVKGSTVNRISVDDFPQYPIPLLDRPEQDRIVSVLGAIDEKIALNKRINAELEAMAKALYDYWFVQFDFQDENGKPYRTSGGAMEWNEQLKREIPKGWKATTLKSFCTVNSGYPFDSNTYETVGQYKLITIKNVQDTGINLNVDNYIECLPLNLPEYCILKDNDILMSLTGNVGRVGLMYNDSCLLNQRVAIIIPSKESIRSYVYFLFRSNSLRATMERMATGTSQKNLSPVDTELLYIPYDSVVSEKYSLMMNSVVKEIVQHLKENEELTALRDWLLPMLMNGQATVE